jgi:hypothetical protein
VKIKRKPLIIIFSFILILFGLCGAVFSFSGIFILENYREDFDNIHNLGLSVAAAVEETAEALKNSNETSENIAGSIRTAKDTLSNASEISYDSGIAFNEVSGMLGFDILGFKPLEDAEVYFSDIGSNLVTLSEDLTIAQDNLETNAVDIERTGSELVNVSEELKEVSVLFNRVVGSYNIYSFVLIIKYLLIYLGVLNIIFIIIGIMFWILGRNSMQQYEGESKN